MRLVFILILWTAQLSVSGQDFKLDRLRNVFDRSLHDVAVLNGQGEELFFLKAESFIRYSVVGETTKSEVVRYYRVLFPNVRLEAEIPYVGRWRLKRFIRDYRLIQGHALDQLSAQKVVRLYPDFFTQERLFAHRLR